MYVSAWNRSYKVFSGTTFTLCFIGNRFDDAKQFAEALPLFEKGVELTDDKPELRSQFYSYLADCYYNLDSVERAFKMFDEVLKINPNDILVLNNYAYYLSLRNERLALAEK